jgi:hypothetical protein
MDGAVKVVHEVDGKGGIDGTKEERFPIIAVKSHVRSSTAPTIPRLAF